MHDQPLVSCLCVSNGRLSQLQNAIDYFRAQTYPNKELIIVSIEHDPQYASLIGSYADPALHYHGGRLPKSASLGERRNYAVQQGAGEYFCVWDDDDWYHVQRIEYQVAAAQQHKKHGSVLPYYILVDSRRKQAFMSLPIPPPASVLCRQRTLLNRPYYQDLPKGEDALLLNALHEKNALVPLINPSLYIYNYHGANTSTQSHIHQFCGPAFSPTATRLIIDIAANKYGCREGSDLLQSTGVLAEFDYFNTFNHSARSRQ